MSTKFIIGSRQTGKTTKLIKEAVGSPYDHVAIVAANKNRALCIRDMLYEMYEDRNIVPVVTIREILTPRSVFTNHYKLYFDDLMMCVKSVIEGPCDIASAVIDDIDEEDKMKSTYNYFINDLKETYKFWTCQSSATPHIDHVIFNGPATIVFWTDGTKTVVKHDGKGRKDKRTAIMYAFMRKIYGEGRPYHDILNEIEEALK